MKLRQRQELQQVMAAELTQSLNILALPLAGLSEYIQQELLDNPFLDENKPKQASPAFRQKPKSITIDPEKYANLASEKSSLQDVLLRQMGICAADPQELKIGQEIIGNVDENGYLKQNLKEISLTLKTPLSKVEQVLKLIQRFDPPGVAARSVSECLLIQLELNNESDRLLKKMTESYLEEIAKKNYAKIAKDLKEPVDKIESRVNKLLKLNPKPGRNYSLDTAFRVIPDIIIEDRDDEGLKISINNEDIPDLDINEDYRKILKNNLNPAEKQYMKDKLHKAVELLRAISKRQTTLRMIAETVAFIQEEAIKENLSFLKPLTFADVAEKIDMHETTVCRAVMNKYARLPNGLTIALKSFFPGKVGAQNGETSSSAQVKWLIKDAIGNEDKNDPLSDQKITLFIKKEKNLDISRRTIAKYRDELKILPSNYRQKR